MQIKIIKPGLLSTVQDLGRPQHQAQAVPISGAMDQLSARLANKALGNADDLATIEFTYANASFSTETDVLIAYSGLGAHLTIANHKLPANRPLFIPKGNTIKLLDNVDGCRTYLAVMGGWQVDEVLGSRSTFLTGKFGGFEGRPLATDDCLRSDENINPLNERILESLNGKEINHPHWAIPRALFDEDSNAIRVVPGPEFNWFDGRSIVDFLNEPFQVGMQSNRMGYQLDGPPMSQLRKQEMLSTAVTFGTIQVTGEGKLILLMADAQTTGGYPRIAQVVAIDLHKCAQMKPNNKLYFKEISGSEAESLYLEREQHLNLISTTIAHQFS